MINENFQDPWYQGLKSQIQQEKAAGNKVIAYGQAHDSKLSKNHSRYGKSHPVEKNLTTNTQLRT
jgi:hypothetical protein